MSINAHLDGLRQAFADQFSNEKDGFIYRKNQKGAPFRVSSLERDRFVGTFTKRVRYGLWSLVPATIILIVLLVWLTPDSDSPTFQIAMWAGLAAIILSFQAVFHWAWGAPSRELKHRLPEGLALTREEARAIAFSKISYLQLGLAALAGVGLIWKMSTKVDVFHGSGLVWSIFGAGIVVFAGVQTFRKWRFDQR
ncbi:hypothetical protein [Novosphingobium sediminicola]|uniref:Uncharacterized protein n=1 Tax=Novosphingobium sediminicola TaxID=563162 RepID=A0A7W6CJR2_9SPHN|nr:hypothetical protein [Novosphingobium sediminicola]MBB3957843.1 hypothetical protein [Novosphingobium sediminicola]